MNNVSPSLQAHPPGAPLIAVRGLSKAYGSLVAVHPADLTVSEGEFCAILGPSGCGKTTLLRMLAGFVTPTAGSIAIDGSEVTALGPERRPTNMVFQSYGLFPHMTVAENVGFGLTIARVPQDERRRRVAEALALVRLEELAERMMPQLSGGQQQRVALARALVMRPRVLLLDEPLAALDLKLRQAMQEELRRIHREIGGTFLFVTHDQSEAFHLASRVLVMNQGAIEQDASPDEIYLKPKTLFVANFVGEANVLSGLRQGGQVTLAATGARFPNSGADGPVHVVVRPEAMDFAGNSAASPDRTLQLSATLKDIVFLGGSVRYLLAGADGQELLVRSSDMAARHAIAPGATVRLSWLLADQRVLER
jgi:spermidine/putrescine transport system ATP-binding protein